MKHLEYQEGRKKNLHHQIKTEDITEHDKSLLVSVIDRVMKINHDYIFRLACLDEIGFDACSIFLDISGQFF